MYQEAEVVKQLKLLTELSFISLFVTLRALTVLCHAGNSSGVIGQSIGSEPYREGVSSSCVCPSCRVGGLAGSAVHGPGHRNAFFFAVHLKPGARGS